MSLQQDNKRNLSMLVLGGAQLGLSYGIANRAGQPDIGCVREILAEASESGLRMIDTAAAYGESEVLLGQAGLSDWKVITKIPTLEAVPDRKVEETVRETTLRSLERLGLDNLQAVLAHDHRDLIGDRGRRFMSALCHLQEEGLIGTYGASIYRPEDLEDSVFESVHIVQAPANVMDQRIFASGVARCLRDRGQQLHVRSLFLQGLLLMSASERPAYFQQWKAELQRFDARLAETGFDALAFCLGFVSRQLGVANCVVGVERPEQLAQIVKAFERGQDAPDEVFDYAADFSCEAPEFIDPRFWKVSR